MSIIGINRDNYVGGPGIVRLESTDSLATVLAVDYLTSQAVEISVLNNGAFDWVKGDMVAVAAADGNALCNFLLEDFSTLILMSIGTENSVLSEVYVTAAGSGTFTPPAGTSYITFEMAGGGGGGGGVVDGGGVATFGAGGGGGAGAYTKGIFSGVTLAPSYAYTIGAGGNGGDGAATGSAGATSSLGSVSVGGALGGVGVTGIADTAAVIVSGGDGGVIYSGTSEIFANGQNGGAGFTMLGQTQSGNGAPSMYDVGGTSITTSRGFANGFPGIRWGSGGGGAASVVAGTFTGGRGADGALLIVAYGAVVL